MRVVKRLYLFVLKSFLPLFAMTFFIVLFIVLMQFLWRYINDLVGKGLSLDVLAELFFYAAVTMVPMALPLAILLASLMTFGNMGEKSELTAIKASGVSLLKVMSPLIGLVCLIAVGAFFFQNDVLPRAQVKMWTLLFSARQKSPELEIPEGAFYDQIPGYNIFVKTKDKNTGMLRDVMIYDVSRGGDNSTIIRADSARLAFSKDMRHLYLHLWNGEQFENLREQKTNDRNVPFRREKFLDKEIFIPFDANFNKIDEGGMANQYIGKNISQLRVAIDSLQTRIDSIGTETRKGFEAEAFPSMYSYSESRGALAPQQYMLSGATTDQSGPGTSSGSASGQNGGQNGGQNNSGLSGPDPEAKPIDLDSLLKAMDAPARDALFGNAANIVKMRDSEMEFRSMQLKDEKKRIRRHRIELIKKFTLSVACIIFLFIGAPLGAIIRKGGLGTPLVISVLLFLFYYIIDNTGYKMARDGYWVAWCGMWLSTFVLLPLGIFVTYKAMNDSAVFNPDLYKSFMRRILGLPESRHVPLKEVIIYEVDLKGARRRLEALRAEARRWLRRHKSPVWYPAYFRGAYDTAAITRIGDDTDAVVKCLSDSRDVRVITLLNNYPVVRSLWILDPVHRPEWLRKVLMWCFPIGGALWLFSFPYARRIKRELSTVERTCTRLLEETGGLPTEMPEDLNFGGNLPDGGAASTAAE